MNIAQARSCRSALQPDRKETIFLAVPTLTGKVHFTAAITFARVMASNGLAECPYKFSVHIEPGTRPIDYARNKIVKTFMNESDADWLVMMDDDEAVPENFWQLCTVSDADIVSGIVPVWVGNMDPESMLRVNNYGVNAEGQCYNLQAPPPEVTNPYRVPVCGTGGIAIRRRVFAPPPHGLGLNPFHFTYTEERKVQAGEDVNFSVDANRLGFVLAVHPGVKFDHMKELPLLQVGRWYDARKKLEDSGKQVSDAQRVSIG